MSEISKQHSDWGLSEMKKIMTGAWKVEIKPSPSFTYTHLQGIKMNSENIIHDWGLSAMKNIMIGTPWSKNISYVYKSCYPFFKFNGKARLIALLKYNKRPINGEKRYKLSVAVKLEEGVTTFVNI